MNREIKFRIWDSELNKWYEPIYEAHLGKLDELLISSSGALCRRFLDENRQERFWHESVFPNRYKKVQYTDLKDKNGKLLCERDVIEVNNDFEDEVCRIPCEIKWGRGQWMAEDSAGGSWTRQLYHQPERIERIGNVFENPDLLQTPNPKLKTPQ